MGTGKDCSIRVGPIQSTPNGGQHYIYNLPVDVKIPNNAKKLGDGLDLRSNGYFCTGEGYTWLPGHEPTNREVTDAPAWLLEKIRELDTKQPRGFLLDANSDRGLEVDERSDFGRVRNTKLDGEYWLNRALSVATVGNRNDTGFFLACQLRDAGISEVDAVQFMMSYTRAVPQNAGEPYTEQEAIASLEQAYSLPARMR